MFADITLVSPLRADGSPVSGAAYRDGVALEEAEHRKRITYPEPASSANGRLQVLALETEGRWSSEAVAFLSSVAWAQAREVPSVLRAAAVHARRARWAAMLFVAAQGSFAATLLSWAPGTVAGCDTSEPPLADALAKFWLEPDFSRLGWMGGRVAG